MGLQIHSFQTTQHKNTLQAKNMPIYRIKCFYVHRFLRRLQGLNQEIRYVFLVFLENISQHHSRPFKTGVFTCPIPHPPPGSLQLKPFYWAANTHKGQWATEELRESSYLSNAVLRHNKDRAGAGFYGLFPRLFKI